MVPVNLRNYFPSYSMTNFFGWIEAGQVFEENTRFEEVLQNLQHVFRTELVKERIADNMNRLVRLEKNPLLRAVPLEIKNLFLLAGTTLGGRSISAIYSNIGKIQLPDVFETYVDSFGFFTSTDKLQMCSCSYGDKMRVGITSKILSHNIQRNFLRILKEEGIHVTEQENDFPGYQIDHPADHNRSNTQKRKNLHTLLHQSQLLFLISGEVILLFCNVNPFLF